MTDQQTTEAQRDAIVAWLEQDDNFLRTTAFSAPSRVYSRRSVADLYEAEQIETRALSELAAAVNAASPGSFWDGKHAKQMLKHYLMAFKVTARAASQPGFKLSKTDEVFGIKTIEEKLNSMCPHFVRLQMLHNPVIRAAMRGSIPIARRKEEKTTKDPVPAKIRRTSQHDKVIPSEGAADQSNQNGAFATPKLPERTEPPKPDQQVDENSVEKGEGTTARNGLSLRLRSADSPKEQGGGGSVTKPLTSERISSSKELTPQKNGKKRAVNKLQQRQKEQKEEEQQKEGASMAKFIAFTSDEEEYDEDLPFLRTKSATVKLGGRLRRSGSKSKSATSDDDEPWLKRKLRRVEASPGKTKRGEMQRTPLRTRAKAHQTPPRATKNPASDKTPVRVTRSTPNRSKKSPGNARNSMQKIVQVPEPAKPATKTTDAESILAKHASETAAPEETPAKKAASVPDDAGKSTVSRQEFMLSISPVPEPAKVANTTASDHPQGKETAATLPETVVQAPAPCENATQAPVMPRSELQAIAPPHIAHEASAAPQSSPQASKTASTLVQPRLQVPDALRSAIAQVVSQRQELLNSRWGRRQIRQPDVSDSDYAPSDHEEEEKAAHVPKDPTPATNATTLKGFKVGQVSHQGAPAVSSASSASSLYRSSAGLSKARLVAGHIPPLLNVPRVLSGDTNLERKRAFFCAKKLAFEQLKSIRENELQQHELELLRREMETREAFAQKEIELQRMDIRADIIQRMVRAGASAEDVVERLALLLKSSKCPQGQFRCPNFNLQTK